MQIPNESRLLANFKRAKRSFISLDQIARGGVQATWSALGLRSGTDPHRGSVGRKFRLLSRTAILIDGGETRYLGPIQLLAYVVLGSPETRGLSADDWNALHERAYRVGLTTDPPQGPVRHRPQPRIRAKPTTPDVRSQRPAIPEDELNTFWQRRASPIAPPASVAAPLSRFAATRRLKTAALYRLAQEGELAFFAPTALRDLPRRPTWLPLTLRWQTRGTDINAAIVLPTFSIDGVRTNIVARALTPAATGPKATRATGIQAAGYFYANQLGRAALAGTPTTDIVITEGETDWLVWTSERPDLAVIGIYSGSITPELGQRLAAATHAGHRVILRTDRDTAGDQYADALTASLRLVGADPTRIYRAIQRNGEEADDSDLWQAGLLDITDPTSDAQPIPATRVDLNEREPWASLPLVTTPAMRGNDGVLARAFDDALARTDGIATGIATSTGSGKSFTAIEKLAAPAQDGIVVLIAPSRRAAVEYRDAFRDAGVLTHLYLGRAGADGLGEKLGQPDPSLGVVTCENGAVLHYSRRGLNVSASCASCPFAATCEAQGGSRGQRLNLKTAHSGVVILTPQMLPAAVDLIPVDLIRTVVFDENPGPWLSTLTAESLIAFKQHIDFLHRGRRDQTIPDDAPEAAAIDALINASAILHALLHNTFQQASSNALQRTDRSADIRQLPDRHAIQAAAATWSACLHAPALSPRHRFPQVRVEAIRLLEELAEDAGAVDVISASLADGALGRLTPTRIAQHHSMPALPAHIPVVFLDATPEPEVWQAVIGRPIEITGGRLMRHENEQAACFHTANHTAAHWSINQRQLAANELNRELDALTPQLMTLCRQRQEAGEEHPLLVITAWRNKRDLIERILRTPLEAMGFAVKFIHWYGTDYRGSNEYTGASVIWTLGTPRRNGDQQRLMRRTLQRATNQPVAEVAEETDWERVQTGALAAITQAIGRARSTIDPEKRPVLFIHSGTDKPACLTELIAAGQGHDHGQLHANNRTAACIEAIGVPFLSQAFADPTLTPNIPDEHRPSKSGIGRQITALRAAGIQPVQIQTADQRMLTLYPMPDAGLEELEEALARLGIELFEHAGEHVVPTNTIRTESASGNGAGIEIEPDTQPGDGVLAPVWSPRVGGFAMYSGRLVEIDGLTKTVACFEDGEGSVWLQAPTSALCRPTARLWATRVGMSVSWRGAPAMVSHARQGVVWLVVGPRLMGVAPEEVDPVRW